MLERVRTRTRARAPWTRTHALWTRDSRTLWTRARALWTRVRLSPVNIYRGKFQHSSLIMNNFTQKTLRISNVHYAQFM